LEVLVTGGTGVLGSRVVKALEERGHGVRVLSRRQGEGRVQGDLAAGTGLAQAVKGVDVIIHAGSATREPWKYYSVDVLGTAHLLAEAQQAGVSHLLYVSIVGMDGVPYPYYRYKLAAEKLVAEGEVPWSILRATQFPQLIDIFLRGFSLLPGLMTVPYRWQFQVVDPKDVAQRLAEVAGQSPSGLLPDFGGPEVQTLEEMAIAWRSARRLRKRMVPLWMPGGFSREVEAGRLLCPEHRDGLLTWEDWLRRRYKGG
jgi:uncharacterized protein YbjT (DUF2867 family)